MVQVGRPFDLQHLVHCKTVLAGYMPKNPYHLTNNHPERSTYLKSLDGLLGQD